MTASNASRSADGGAYDPDLRHPTPLAAKLAALIRAEGPVPVSRYMDACLNDPEYGYYRHRPAIGRGGDFITAPEISQTFGELIGLWCAVVWQQMGAPTAFQLIELGPGRGTLMADALRAARLVPGFLDAAEVVLVETDAALRAAQQQALEGTSVPLQWVSGADTLDATEPAIFIANEFLDTLPVDQFMRHAGGWRQRLVGLDAHERLAFIDCAETESASGHDLDVRFPNAREGEVVTVADYGDIIDRWLAPSLTTLGSRPAVTALLIDYGERESCAGDTLQAVRNHHYEHPLSSPGEADLSALVDFGALARHAGASGLAVDGPVTQAGFLGSLGIVERASRLMSANPGSAAAIEAGVARLIAPNAMGGRFKAIGVKSRHLPSLPGFA